MSVHLILYVCIGTGAKENANVCGIKKCNKDLAEKWFLEIGQENRKDMPIYGAGGGGKVAGTEL